MKPVEDKNAATERYKLIRERWDKEDALLISRTGIFLTANSILYAAMGFQAKTPGYQVGVAVMGLLLSVLWLMTSWHTTNVIRKLYQMCIGDMPYDLADIYKIKPKFFRPTTVFGKVIPGLIIAGWLAFILWLLFSMKM
jgi:hypothetical protein